MKASSVFLLLGLAALIALAANLRVVERERRAVLAENATLQPQTGGIPELEARRDELQRQLGAAEFQDAGEKAGRVPALKERLKQARLRYQRAMMSDFPAADAPASSRGPTQNPVPWKPVVRWTKGQWQVRDRSTPLAAFETLIAATEAGDAEGVDKVIALTMGGELAAKGILDQLAPETRAVWSTPRSLVATLLTVSAAQDCAAVTVLDVSGNRILIRWETSQGTSHDLLFQAEHEADGFRILVPIRTIQQAWVYSGGSIR